MVQQFRGKLSFDSHESDLIFIIQLPYFTARGMDGFNSSVCPNVDTFEHEFLWNRYDFIRFINENDIEKYSYLNGDSSECEPLSQSEIKPTTTTTTTTTTTSQIVPLAQFHIASSAAVNIPSILSSTSEENPPRRRSSFTDALVAISSTNKVAPLSTSDLPRQHILIVDDVKSARKIFTHMLKSLGHSVHEASDGSEAIKMIELSKVFNTPYNCMFIDSVMVRLGKNIL